MKMRCLILPIFLFCISCEKNTLLSPNLQKCTFSDNEWFVYSEIHNIEGTVVLDSLDKFFIDFKDTKETGWERLIACNMPQSFKVANRKVKISGNIYSHPRMDYRYAPIELTSINFSE